MSPFVRNILIVAAVAALIVVLNQETALSTAGALVRVAFFIAIAVAVYFFWRDFGRREIGIWPAHAQVVFYGSAVVIVLDLAHYFWRSNLSGLDGLAFFLVLGLCGFAMWRVWQSQRTYGG
jgi:hypothetical protein